MLNSEYNKISFIWHCLDVEEGEVSMHGSYQVDYVALCLPLSKATGVMGCMYVVSYHKYTNHDVMHVGIDVSVLNVVYCCSWTVHPGLAPASIHIAVVMPEVCRPLSQLTFV